MKKIQKILVANRAEIACRVIRTAKEMGIKTVAVFSDVDRCALHVIHADEAYPLCGNMAKETYLNQEKILTIAKKSGADAIHPGYGFLSENASFAELVIQSGFIFIGPSPHSIRLMGDKLSAKNAVRQFDVPMVPGSPDSVTEVKEAAKIAEGIRYPVMIKASAGGGGKGMRAVENEKQLVLEFERAKSEADSAFSDNRVFIEKILESPKHIEIQILADQHGHCIYLFERECSIQRRHQKVIEEAPSAVVDEALRARLGEAAINVAKASKYVGAGTVEFLVDNNLNFYFLEMNTRLQVEHPVTEMITGVDLVKEQILIAEGRKLGFDQAGLSINGHAVELRIYAEDPDNQFTPDIGKLEKFQKPEGEGIRLDTGYEEGMDIPIYYDPMIAKLIVHAKNRELAIDKMIYALQSFQISGVKTTLGFGMFAMIHEAFRSGKFDTHWVDRYFLPSRETDEDIDPEDAKLAAAFGALVLADYNAEAKFLPHHQNKPSKWKTRKWD